MKKILNLLSVLMILPLLADEAPMMVERDADLNYYLILDVEYTEMDNESAPFFGAQVGTCINDRWDLGVGFYGVIDDVKLGDGTLYEPLKEWDLWYVGATIAYHFFPYQLVDLSVGCLAGGAWGDVTASTPEVSDENVKYFVLRPSVNVTVNVTEIWQIGAAAGYRWMEGGDSDALSDKDSSGLGVSLFVRLNEF